MLSRTDTAGPDGAADVELVSFFSTIVGLIVRGTPPSSAEEHATSAAALMSRAMRAVVIVIAES
jgi:hypothetical protein